MKLEHVAMYVEDLERAKDFFVKYFDAKPNNKYHNPKTGLSTYFLSFDDGSRLEIMNRPDMIKAVNEPFRQGFIHIAFCVGSKEKVDGLTQRLSDDGYKIFSNPRTSGDGYYESCIVDIENNLIEIIA